jgi:hypothetical protein
MIGISLTTVISFDSAGTIINKWGKIMVVPTIVMIAIIARALLIAPFQNLSGYCLNPKKVPIFQRISSFTTLSIIFLTLYILVD